MFLFQGKVEFGILLFDRLVLLFELAQLPSVLFVLTCQLRLVAEEQLVTLSLQLFVLLQKKLIASLGLLAP